MSKQNSKAALLPRLSNTDRFNATGNIQSQMGKLDFED